MTDEQIKSYRTALDKAKKAKPTVIKMAGEVAGFSVHSSFNQGVIYLVELPADKTLDGATCECDEVYQHVCCYHRAAAFIYYVDTVLATKLATGWETIIGYESEGKTAEFISGKEELWKKQLKKYTDLCDWRKEIYTLSNQLKVKPNETVHI